MSRVPLRPTDRRRSVLTQRVPAGLLAIAVMLIGLSLTLRSEPVSAATFPGEPFNGLQISYEVAGAVLGPPTDIPGFTWVRRLEGAVAGDTVTVSGGATGVVGRSVELSVELTDHKGNVDRFEHGGEVPYRGEFRVSIPVAPDATNVSFEIKLTGYYNHGIRGVDVYGSLSRDYTPPSTETPTATPTPTVTPTPAYDITIADVEFTQAVQCMDFGTGDERCAENAIPLVKGKRTAVRVYLTTERVSGNVSPGDIGPVDARLTLLTPPGGQIAPGRGRPRGWWTIPYPPRDLHLVSQREGGMASLDFRLPLAASRGDRLSVRVEINPDRALPETDYDNNVREVSMSLEDGRPIRVMVVPVRSQDAFGLYDLPPSPARTIHRYMNKIYPVPFGGVHLTVAPPRTFRGQIWAERDRFMRWLNMQVALPHLLGAEHAPDQLVGYVPPGGLTYTEPDGTVWQINGVSDPTWMSPPGSGRVAFVAAADGQEEVTLAHEVAHNLNQRHPSREPAGSPNNFACGASDGDSPWRYPNARITETGYDPAVLRIYRATQYYDFMSYCDWRRKWVSPFHYHRLFMELLRLGVPGMSVQDAAVFDDSSRAGSLPAQNAVVQSDDIEYALVSGVVRRDGTAEIAPLVRVTGSRTTPELTGPSTGEFCLDLVGSATERRCFDVDFLGTEFEALEAESFFFTMPVPPDPQYVSLTRGGSQLDRREASTHPPTVAFDVPTPGDAWDGPRSVRWTASDADGDRLEYTLLYSPDGSRWTTLDAMMEETEASVDFGALPGGFGGRLRVLASDGFHTTAAEVGPVTVLPKAPRPSILEPADGATFIPDATVVMEGVAVDPEDGPVDGGGLTWASDRDGMLGTGAALDIEGLSPGRHVISLQATDSDGQTGTHTVVIRIERPEIYLPYSAKRGVVQRPTAMPRTPMPTATEPVEQLRAQVVELVNRERRALGLPSLSTEEHLAQAATWFAEAMAAEDRFRDDHIDRLGRGPVARLQAFGYGQSGYVSWRVAENIAAGQTTPEELVADWMASPIHRDNMLEPGFCDVGIGYGRADRSSLTHYWVMDLGCRDASVPASPTSASSPSPTPTRTSPATPTRVVVPTSTPPAGGLIHGTVTVAGEPIGGLSIALVRAEDSTSAGSPIVTTTLTADGQYRFIAPPPLTGSQRYYVRYQNVERDPSRVAVWSGPEIASYSDGMVVSGGDFDLANVVLSVPAAGATVPMPVTFRWQRRDIAGDSYQWVLYDPEASVAWTSARLGNMGEYVLDRLPDGAEVGRPYWWYLRVFAGDDSYGVSFYYQTVTFTEAGETYIDDFCDPDSGWPSGDNEIVRYGYRDLTVGCEYFMAFRQAGRGWWATSGRAATNFTVESNVAFTGAGGAGLVFGITAGGDVFHSAIIDTAGQFQIARYADGEWTLLVPPTTSPVVDPSFGNRLRIDARDGTLIFQIDGTEVARLTDQSVEGPIGYYAESWQEGFEATFTDFRLTADGPMRDLLSERPHRLKGMLESEITRMQRQSSIDARQLGSALQR